METSHDMRRLFLYTYGIEGEEERRDRKMQRGRGQMGDFFGFGDPFAGLGGFGRSGSLISSIFGGRDPFDDPFFTNPFGSGPSMFGASPFGSSMFAANPFGSLPTPFGFLENAGQQVEQAPLPKKSSGPIIREITSDDEEEEVGEKGAGSEGEGVMKEGNRKHPRPDKEPCHQMANEEADEKKRRHVQRANNFSNANFRQSQPHAYTFQSTKVTYGGPSGAYYTSSTTRKMGGDGVTFEECKEADATTGKATHRISRGLHEKGHSVTRRLDTDGKVDTMQMLHNLNEDELPRFAKEWSGNAKKNIPGWNTGLDALENGNMWTQGSSSGSSRQGWALPSTVQEQRHIPNSNGQRHIPNSSGQMYAPNSSGQRYAPNSSGHEWEHPSMVQEQMYIPNRRTGGPKIHPSNPSHRRS